MNRPVRSTILIVDDQEENLRVVGTVLAAMDYDIVPAASAEQAFKRIASRKPDLILLDMFMPEMDGLEMCQQLQADAALKDIPVIFLSAADDKNVIVQALEAGGVDYVTKPFNKAELISRVRTQLSLKQTNDKLRALAEDKDEILGILAHDLKNHIVGINLGASLLQERAAELPPKCASLVDNIMRTSERMIAFVKEFLANQSAERLRINPAPVNLSVVSESLMASYKTAAAAKRIRLDFQAPPEPQMVMADPTSIHQALENLLSNAIKFTPEGGAVTITIEPGATGRTSWTIRDTGPGFTVEDHAKMFHRYGRLSARPTGGESSSGLGLSIVKRLIDTMGGRITCESRPGAGAMFVVALPRAAG